MGAEDLNYNENMSKKLLDMKQYRLNAAIAYRGLAKGIDSREAQKAVNGIEEILKKKS